MSEDKDSTAGKGFLGWLRKNFLTGLVVTLPSVVTLYLIYYIWTIVSHRLEVLIPPWARDYRLLPYAYKFLELIGLVLLVALIGNLTRLILIKRLIGLADRVFIRIPVLGMVYRGVQDISKAFFSTRKGFFKSIVLFEYPRKGLYSLGFVVGEARGEAQEKTKEEVLCVFVPTTPNPTSGIFLLVPKNEALVLSMSVEDGMKMVMSGGLVTPGSWQDKPAAIAQE